MTKKNIYIIIGFSIALFLLLIGFLFFFNSINKKIASTPSSSQVKNQTVESQQPGQSNVGQPVSSNTAQSGTSTSPLGLAIQNNDINQCLKVKNNTDYVNTCILLLANHAKNKTFCASIADPVKSQYCIDRVVYDEAISGNKISLCLGIKSVGLNQSCVENIITKMSNLKKSDCETLPDAQRSYCLNYLNFSTAMIQFYNAKSVNDCQSISDAEIKQECLNKFAK
jgi:hypothetical protein